MLQAIDEDVVQVTPFFIHGDQNRGFGQAARVRLIEMSKWKRTKKVFCRPSTSEGRKNRKYASKNKGLFRFLFTKNLNGLSGGDSLWVV